MAAAAKKIEQLTKQSSHRRALRHNGLKNMCVAYFINAPDRAFFLKSGNDSLDCRVRRPVFLRKSLQQFAHRRAAQSPERAHHLQFELRQSDRGTLCHLSIFTNEKY